MSIAKPKSMSIWMDILHELIMKSRNLYSNTRGIRIEKQVDLERLS